MGIEAFASPICAHAIIPPLITRCGRTPKNAGSHSTRSASLPRLDRADLVVEAVRDRRADRVLGDVAAGPQVVRRVVGAAVAGQEPAAPLHHVRGLPGAQHDLADPAHRLRVRADHRDRAEVVQQVLGGDRRRPDPALRERQVLRHRRVEVVADHEHVEVLVERVHGVRPGRVRRRRQHVRVRGDRDDVRRVPAARRPRCGTRGCRGRRSPRASTRRSRPRSACRCGSRPARRRRRRPAGRRRSTAGVVPQSSCSLKPPAPARSCSHIDSSDIVLPLPSSATLTGRPSIASSMRCRYQGAAVTVVALVPSAGPVPPPMSVVMPAAERLVQDLRADQVHVAVDRAGGEDLAVAGDDLGARADDQVGVDAVHGVGVAGLAERDDPAVADADVGLDDAPVVEHHRAGDDSVRGALGAGGAALAHRLADHLAAAEHHLVAGPARAAAAVLGDLDRAGRCRRAGSGRRRSGRRAARTRSRERSTQASGSAVPVVAPASRAPGAGSGGRGRRGRPRSGTRSTSRSTPGSKRTAVPAGTSSRWPCAAARSNSSAALACAKW